MFKAISRFLGLTKPAPKAIEARRQTRQAWNSAKDYPMVDIVTASVIGTASDAGAGKLMLGSQQGVPDAVGLWFASQGAIQPMQAAWISKHWMINKALSMPARDALRQGWEIDGPSGETIERLKEEDKKRNIGLTLQEFITSARRAGGAVAIFHTCPDGEDEDEYYAAPLNDEAVTEYRGIAIVDASDARGEVLSDSIRDPAALRYMCPDFYRIGARRYHYTHCVECVPYPVANSLKATYGYFGQSVSERLFLRVYAAERTADEAPNLTMSKRTRILGVDLDAILSDPSGEAKNNLAANVQGLQEMADNFGVFVYDSSNGGGLSQIDTSLGDLDVTIMTQYQLVASIAEVPATKLLGTTPKGFNSTGESEAQDYRQTLESIQTLLMQPLLDMHYKILLIAKGIDESADVTWAPLDSPTAAQFASIDAQNASTVATLVAQSVITPTQAAAILGQSKDSIFFGVLDKEAERENGEIDKMLDEIETDETDETRSDNGDDKDQ